jgi:integrase
MSLIKSSEEGKCLSPKTANNILSTLKVMLREAFRLGDIPTNPTSSVRKFMDKPKETGLLSAAEVRELFNSVKIDTIWGGDRRHRTISEIAMHTGARIGEIQALKRENIHDGYIDISATWGRKYGLKDPKWGSTRKVPIPRIVYKDISELTGHSPYAEPHDFVFCGGDPEKPLDHKTIYEVLYQAFAAIGIAEGERRRRNITFHSWRDYLNTFMRGKVADAKLRRVTGHKTPAMTERYTNFSLEDFDDLAKCQEGMLA